MIQLMTGFICSLTLDKSVGFRIDPKKVIFPINFDKVSELSKEAMIKKIDCMPPNNLRFWKEQKSEKTSGRWLPPRPLIRWWAPEGTVQQTILFSEKRCIFFFLQSSRQMINKQAAAVAVAIYCSGSK